MIILNGMVGLSLLIGGWRHREQQYNFQSANTYLSVIIQLAILSLVLPGFTKTTTGRSTDGSHAGSGRIGRLDSSR
jgi:Ca2+:H+ antiporter